MEGKAPGPEGRRANVTVQCNRGGEETPNVREGRARPRKARATRPGTNHTEDPRMPRTAPRWRDLGAAKADGTTLSAPPIPRARRRAVPRGGRLPRGRGARMTAVPRVRGAGDRLRAFDLGDGVTGCMRAP